MSVKLLNEHNLEFLGLTGDCPGTSESALVKMQHCWKSHIQDLISFCYRLVTADRNETVDVIPSQSGRVVKAYKYYQTCIATKTFEFFGFLSEARNDTPNVTACCTNVPNLILLKIGHLCSSFVQVFP